MSPFQGDQLENIHTSRKERTESHKILGISWALVGIKWACSSGQSRSLVVNDGHIKNLANIGLSPNFLCSPNENFMEPHGSRDL